MYSSGVSRRPRKGSVLMPAYFLPAKIKRSEVVAVRLRVVARDFEDFRDQTLSWPALQLDDDVQRIGNVALDCVIGQVDPTLQDATGKARQPLLGGGGVDGG